MIPSFVHLDEETFSRITLSGAKILAGPRTGVKTNGFQIPHNLSLEGLGFKVTRIDALPQELPIEVEWKGIKGHINVWREQGQCSGTSDGKGIDDMPVVTTGNKGSYLCGWPDENLLKAIMKEQNVISRPNNSIITKIFKSSPTRKPSILYKLWKTKSLYS